jgi:transposase-like protein
LALDRDELKKLLKEKGVKSLDDFNAFMREVSYGYEISPETISSITGKVMERAREWQSRPLESI